MPEISEQSAGLLIDQVELFRLGAGRRLDTAQRGEKGQFFTPPALARLMASMFEESPGPIRLLDAGAGVGNLTAAFVEAVCQWPSPPPVLSVRAWEIDEDLGNLLNHTLRLCGAECERRGIAFEAQVHRGDFIEEAVGMLDDGLFAAARETANFAILNPPYRKTHSHSAERRLMRRVGIETSNLYTSFMALTVKLLEPGGQLVAITPRSFFNGPYFKPFRAFFLAEMDLRRIHSFEKRDLLFGDADVLQENVILHAGKGRQARRKVAISSSLGAEDHWVSTRLAEKAEIITPGDPECFIRIPGDELDSRAAAWINRLHTALPDLDLSVSTGRVVDFRARTSLCPEPGPDTVPLIYPGHLQNGAIVWPRTGWKKPNAIRRDAATEELLMPAGVYVLVKRFSAKEERRRVVAALFEPRQFGAGPIGFENHLNVYHRAGAGMDLDLAKGLVFFLNSTLTDLYFRQFSGHTQVNATDLRQLKYPTRAQLERLGSMMGETLPPQDEIDQQIRQELFPVEDTGPDPTQAKQKIGEALAILKALGLPREQQNERSALTLLALANIRPEMSWKEALAPLSGITPMMSFFARYYGKQYAPNTRETVRRFTVHQFVDAGLAIANPDEPARPVNSPKAVYQLEESALELLKTFGTKAWDKRLAQYLSSVTSLKERYAREREMHLIPVRLPSGQEIQLSPGGQNPLIKEIIEAFCPRFAPDSRLIYVGDTEEKWAIFDEQLLRDLGVRVDTHGKMPDVVVYHQKKDWLLLIEAVTSHGPVNAKRRNELKKLFAGSTAGLVYVTAFADRKAMVKYLSEISWETEVWIAETPSHMIHFDGERFLGPYPGGG
jgi:adenine-specific DNA-methyltransferase